MARTYAGEIRLIISLVIVAVVIGFFLQTIFHYVTTYFPVIAPYENYITDGLIAVLIFGFSHLILRTIRAVVEVSSQRSSGRNYRWIYTIFRALIYGIAIAVFLAYIGISLTGALIGGTIGGLIISFALQNTVSSMLSGLLLASSGVIKPKEPMFFFSWLFDNPVVGEVLDVKLLTVDVKTVDGLVTSLPNTALLGQAQFTTMRDGKLLKYNTTIGFNTDVPVRQIMQEGDKSVSARAKELGIVEFQSYFFTKTFNNNSIKIVFTFSSLDNFNEIMSAITLAYEEAYWAYKNRDASQQGK